MVVTYLFSYLPTYSAVPQDRRLLRPKAIHPALLRGSHRCEMPPGIEGLVMRIDQWRDWKLNSRSKSAKHSGSSYGQWESQRFSVPTLQQEARYRQQVHQQLVKSFRAVPDSGRVQPHSCGGSQGRQQRR